MNRKQLLKGLRVPQKRVSIQVPEFGDDARVFFSALTPADEIKIESLVEGWAPEPHESNIYRSAALMIQKLEDEDGDKLLTSGDITLLLNMKSQVLVRIAQEISLGEGDNYLAQVEDEKKPSDTTEND